MGNRSRGIFLDHFLHARKVLLLSLPLLLLRSSRQTQASYWTHPVAKAAKDGEQAHKHGTTSEHSCRLAGTPVRTQ